LFDAPRGAYSQNQRDIAALFFGCDAAFPNTDAWGSLASSTTDLPGELLTFKARVK
jgi:hypothetical protein